MARCVAYRAEKSRSLTGADVHVGVEEVLWVVLLLELTQPGIVGPICHRRRVARLVSIEIVYVAEGAEIRSERGVGLATPRDSPLGVVRLGPLRHEDHIEAVDAHGARGRVDGHAAGRAVEVLDDDLAHRRGTRLEAL